MKYIPLIEQLKKNQNKIGILDSGAQKMMADIDYIAMMCDVDLDNPEELQENIENFNEEE